MRNLIPLLIPLLILVVGVRAPAETWRFEGAAVNDLGRLTREQLFTRWPPVQLPEGRPPQLPGHFVLYRHEGLTYYFGPYLRETGARRAEDTLRELRSRLIRMDDKFATSEVQLVRTGTDGGAPDEWDGESDPSDEPDGSNPAPKTPTPHPAEESQPPAPQPSDKSDPETQSPTTQSPPPAENSGDGNPSEDEQPSPTPDPKATPPQEATPEPTPAPTPTPIPEPAPTPTPEPTPAKPTPEPTATPIPTSAPQPPPSPTPETPLDPPPFNTSASPRNPSAFWIISAAIVLLTAGAYAFRRKP